MKFGILTLIFAGKSSLFSKKKNQAVFNHTDEQCLDKEIGVSEVLKSRKLWAGLSKPVRETLESVVWAT